MAIQHPTARPDPRLLRWLEDHAVDHDVHDHELAYTAQATARAEGVDPRTFAKVVGVGLSDGRRVIVVLDATDHLDLAKVRRYYSAADARILSEAEFARIAPDCEVGALPPVGALFDTPTLADLAVRDDPAISFNAGTHRHAVRVDRAAWERAANVAYADVAVESDGRPAWARS